MAERTAPVDPFPGWFADLWRRHTAELAFPEIRRALQALSSLYVERRGRLGEGAALTGAGKRAAFAVFYGPLHFLTVREVVRALRPPPPRRGPLVELGCGTAAAGAAWALEAPGAAYLGVDRSPWALAEARLTLSRLRVAGRVRPGEAGREPLSTAGAVLLAWTANELAETDRDAMLPALLEAGERGTQVLVVEPLARRALPWWERWAREFARAGGREDEWRFPAALPEPLALLDRAAGLDHRRLTARTLWLPGAVSGRPAAAPPAPPGGGRRRG